MPKQIVMDLNGDTRHEFDSADAIAVQEAEKRFMELTGAGFTAGRRKYGFDGCLAGFAFAIHFNPSRAGRRVYGGCVWPADG